MSLRPALADTLGHLCRLAATAGVSPVVFGAAVIELHGLAGVEASDLDVILDAAGARALAAAAGITPGGDSGNDQFRSQVHVQLGGAPLVIDVMADMQIRTPDGWQLYAFGPPDTFEAPGWRVRAVAIPDLLRFYRLAGRAKDRAKIALLETAAAAASNSI